MAVNAYEMIMCRTPRLMTEALEKNHDVSAFLQACYIHLEDFAATHPKDPRKIKLDYTVIGDNRLRITARHDPYMDFEEGSPPALFRQILWRRNPNIADLMRVNGHVADLAWNTVRVLELWLSYNHYRKDFSFADVRLMDAVVNQKLEGIAFLANILLQPQFDTRVSEQMEWDKVEELPEEEQVFQSRRF